MVDLEFLASIPISNFLTRLELEAAEKLFSEMVSAIHLVLEAEIAPIRQAAPGLADTVAV